MLHIERVLKQTRLCLALTGLRPEEFLNLLTAFAEALKRKKQRDYANNPDRERNLGGGRKGFVPSVSDKLFFVLLYYKCYPTYDVMAFFYGCNRSNAMRRQKYLSGILESTLGKKLVLPKRQLRNVEDFLKAFPEAKEVFIDGTERPIQRPKDSQKQKANYSGKKRRHTRKNLIISDRKKRIGFLSKTVAGKQHDFAILREHAPPKYIPVTVRQRVDLGFKGYQKQYPNHCVSMPQRKPRTKELSQTVKEQNARKSRIRVLVEHAIGGIKRFRITTDVFRNKLKDFDDQVMLISSGLWNYHLSMR
jgi:hypothetical protein